MVNIYIKPLGLDKESSVGFCTPRERRFSSAENVSTFSNETKALVVLANETNSFHVALVEWYCHRLSQKFKMCQRARLQDLSAIYRLLQFMRYDVASFVTHRMFESGDPEVRVRFVGFGAEEDEWVNVRKCVRQHSLPCESSECVAVLPGDLILCFQHFESFVREHFHQRGHYILGAYNDHMMGAQVGCLLGEAMMGVHGRADTQSTSSIGLKIMLAKLIPKFVSAFKEVGADCEEFVNASKHFAHVEKATI